MNRTWLQARSTLTRSAVHQSGMLTWGRGWFLRLETIFSLLLRHLLQNASQNRQIFISANSACVANKTKLNFYPATCCVCVCVSGPRLARRLRMFLSDIWSRTATGGIRAMVAGRRVTSAFMSLSSSSNCFSTETQKALIFIKYK